MVRWEIEGGDTRRGATAPGWLRKVAAWGGWALAVLQGILNAWPGGQ